MNIVKYRKYCKKCGDYTLHDKVEDENFICTSCSSPYMKTPLEEIPEDIKQRQQDRYRDNRARELNRITPYILSGFSRDYDFLSEPTVKQTIVESDAGYRRKRYLEAWKDKKQSLIHTQFFEYRDNLLKNTQRNGKCPCGSGLKFKKCCLLNPSKAFDLDTDKLNSDLDDWSIKYKKYVMYS